MAIERLGTENDPDVVPLSRIVDVVPEPSREDLIRDAAQILVDEEEILIDDEMEHQRFGWQGAQEAGRNARRSVGAN